MSGKGRRFGAVLQGFAKPTVAQAQGIRVARAIPIRTRVTAIGVQFLEPAAWCDCAGAWPAARARSARVSSIPAI
jgi:hypothetical protein